MSTSSPDSTDGSSASCWALLKRWTSSRNRIVPWPRSPRRCSARAGGFPDVLHGGRHRRELLERLGRGAGDELGDRGLPGTGRAPEDDRRQAIGLDERPQGLAGAEEVLLADHLVERGRSQAGRQGRLTHQTVLRRCGKEVPRHFGEASAPSRNLCDVSSARTHRWRVGVLAVGQGRSFVRGLPGTTLARRSTPERSWMGHECSAGSVSLRDAPGPAGDVPASRCAGRVGRALLALGLGGSRRLRLPDLAAVRQGTEGHA